MELFQQIPEGKEYLFDNKRLRVQLIMGKKAIYGYEFSNDSWETCRYVRFKEPLEIYGTPMDLIKMKIYSHFRRQFKQGRHWRPLMDHLDGCFYLGPVRYDFQIRIDGDRVMENLGFILNNINTLVNV